MSDCTDLCCLVLGPGSDPSVRTAEKLEKLFKELFMVRAKFRCVTKTTNADGPAKYSYLFFPVYSSDPASENKAFWDATPSGELKMTCILSEAFEVGKSYYLDFTPAD